MFNQQAAAGENFLLRRPNFNVGRRIPIAQLHLEIVTDQHSPLRGWICTLTLHSANA
jgi:hypothetical protein